jgi:hypothetical protein
VTSIDRRLARVEERLQGEKELRDELRRALLEVRAIVARARG